MCLVCELRFERLRLVIYWGQIWNEDSMTHSDHSLVDL